ATGSLVIALAVAEGWIDGARAYEAAHVDELYQAKLWGEDAEAARRRAALRCDIEAAARFLALTRG
ncbi:MAG TPA: ATPase, partial [Alphaproteobacteria bacterium]